MDIRQKGNDSMKWETDKVNLMISPEDWRGFQSKVRVHNLLKEMEMGRWEIKDSRQQQGAVWEEPKRVCTGLLVFSSVLTRAYI